MDFIFSLEYFDYLWFYLPDDVKSFVFLLLGVLIALAVKRALFV